MKQNFIDNIFLPQSHTDDLIFELFAFQYQENLVYQRWCNFLHKNPKVVNNITDIPFLPVSFFKTHKIVCGNFEPETIFETSGTTNTINGKHYLKSLELYEKSFLKTFENFYGDLSDYCVIGLLPSYLERKNSSLVYMTDVLIKKSGHNKSGYYLYNFNELATVLQSLEKDNQKTILFGVTFALLDFAEKFSFPLKNTIIMDTGGMKGRKKEMTRSEVHNILKQSFSVQNIHSEYGMTELLSQAYSQGNGIFSAPNWLKVFVRDESDPLQISQQGKGLINIIDLANVYSCSFLATDDIGTIFPDGTFSVWGRRDNSDLRGCSLMVI